MSVGTAALDLRYWILLVFPTTTRRPEAGFPRGRPGGRRSQASAARPALADAAVVFERLTEIERYYPQAVADVETRTDKGRAGPRTVLEH